MGWDYLSTPKLQRLHHWSLGIYKLFIPFFITGIITYPSWDKTLIKLIPRWHFSKFPRDCSYAMAPQGLTYWSRATYICVSKLTIISLDDKGLTPGWRHTIIWNHAGILLIRILGTNFSEILNEMHTFSFKKMQLKMSSAKWRLFRLGLRG